MISELLTLKQFAVLGTYHDLLKRKKLSSTPMMYLHGSGEGIQSIAPRTLMARFDILDVEKVASRVYVITCDEDNVTRRLELEGLPSKVALLVPEKEEAA